MNENTDGGVATKIVYYPNGADDQDAEEVIEDVKLSDGEKFDVSAEPIDSPIY